MVASIGLSSMSFLSQQGSVFRAYVSSASGEPGFAWTVLAGWDSHRPHEVDHAVLELRSESLMYFNIELKLHRF